MIGTRRRKGLMMPDGEAPRARRASGAPNLLVLFLLPLIALALLDIRHGAEDLTLEWTVVAVGLLAIGAIQIGTLAARWRGARREDPGRVSPTRSAP